MHDATLYDEHNADWTSFSRLQATVLREDARIHLHISHYRETEQVRSERRCTPGNAQQSGTRFPQRAFRGGRRAGQGGYASSHGSAPCPTFGP